MTRRIKSLAELQMIYFNRLTITHNSTEFMLTAQEVVQKRPIFHESMVIWRTFLDVGGRGPGSTPPSPCNES